MSGMMESNILTDKTDKKYMQRKRIEGAGMNWK
jgi:hypothetical protein